MKRRHFLKLASYIPNPLVLFYKKKQEIFLFDFYLAGYRYYKAPYLIGNLTAGQQVFLRTEPDNIYDNQAIEVYTKTGYKLGYVSMDANIIPYNLFRNDIKVTARIQEIDEFAEEWERILIRVFQIIDN